MANATVLQAIVVNPFNSGVLFVPSKATIDDSGNMVVPGSFTLGGPFTLNGNAHVTGTLLVDGLSTLTGGVTTPANYTTTGTGSVVVGGTGTLSVAGLSTLTGGFTTPANSSLTGTATLTVAGSVTAASFIPTGSTVPANGVYLPAANTLGFASNTAVRATVNSTGNWLFSVPSSGNAISVVGFNSSTSLNLDGGVAVTSAYTATISLTDTAVKFLNNSSSRPFAFLGNWASATIPSVATTAIYGTPSITTFTNNSFLGCLIGGSTAATDYSGIDFTGNNQTTPIGRIALLSTGSGSQMKFGTSNNFASGITNTAITIGITGAVTLGVATSTGYGTPTGNVKTSNFPGATATLLQTSEMVAQLIIDLKTFGVLGA